MGTDQPVDARDDNMQMLFAAFYEAELPGQLRSATLILGSRSAAADVVHDAFTQVLQSWSDIDNPGPYLQRTVINRCRDARRHQRVVDQKLPLLAPEPTPEVDAPLYDALSALPFNHRAALVLRFYLQLAEAEIADHLDCAPGSVGPWIRRGLDQLAIDLQLPPEETT